jgi:VIT1/CCC1 family predicted Fe2+/Mn2+ transporter
MLVCVVFWLLSGLLAGSRDVGFAATSVSVAGLLSGFLNLGLGFAMLREVPERGSRGLSAALLIALFSVFLGLSLLF